MRRKAPARTPTRADLGPTSVSIPALPFERFTQADRRKLLRLARGHLDKLQWRKFLEALEEAVFEHLYEEVLASTRIQSAEMAQIFQQFALHAMKDIAAAMFVASRLGVHLGSAADVETLSELSVVKTFRTEAGVI